MNYSHLLLPYSILKTIGEVADRLEMKAYVVGGFVRDLMLKRDSCDIDIVCIGSGISLARAVAQHLHIGHVAEFQNFGTAMIKTKFYEIEFVGARKESYNRDSRNPIVEDGTLEEDQHRRDFTINALSICLNNKDWGSLIDPFNGMLDLQNKILKTPLDPAKTFSDDPLRMIRAVRFAVQLHMQIDQSAIEAIALHCDRIRIVSQERIATELNKIISTSVPSHGFRLLDKTGLLKIIFPEFVALKGIETVQGLSHKENFDHTLQVLDNVAKVSNNLWLRWAAILHDIAKPLTKRFEPKVGFTFHGHECIGAKMVVRIFKNMRLPLNSSMLYVQNLVKLHLRPIALAKDFVTDSAVRRLIYEAGNDIDDLMILCRADITSKNDEKIQRYLQNFDRIEEKILVIEEKDKVKNFQPVITGEIIMKALNLPPGAMVGNIKNAIKDAILDGHIRNEYEEAYNYMLDLAKQNGIDL
jgi:poly(A) polymerase